MKREILFKAIRIDNGEWIEGSLIHRPEKIAENNNEYSAIVIFDKGIDSVYNAYLELEVHPDTACQFTGLLDKNGVEIFDGDKIYVCSGYSSIVEFQDGMFVSVYKHSEDGETMPLLDVIGKDTVVIGNIHDKIEKP